MEIKIVKSSQSISAVYRYDNLFRIAICDISKLDDTTWLVNRVNVPIDKGNGIGSAILNTAIDELKKDRSIENLIVYPGGYDNNIEQQINFYKKNGFVFNDNQHGLKMLR